MASSSRAAVIDWREVDQLSRGHGVEIACRGEDGRSTTLAFIVGFEWRRGAARAEVEVLRVTASEWARVGGDTPALRDELAAIVHEVIDSGQLLLQRGRLSVIANA